MMQDSTLRLLAQIGQGLVALNFRVPTDPEAKPFKLNQLQQSVSGTKVREGSIQTHHDRGDLNSALLDMSTIGDSHLALKKPSSIGCHSPHLSAQDKMSVLQLHESAEHCRRCASSLPVSLTDVPMNPYRCWRRGHRSAHFGFLLNQLVVPSAENLSGWHIDPSRRLQTAHRLKLALQKIGFGIKVQDFPKKAHYMGRSMVLVTTVKWSAVAGKEADKSLARILDVQMLHSASWQIRKQSKNFLGEEQQLYDVLRDLVQSLDRFWKEVGLSKRNCEGILSIAVIHAGAGDDLDFLRSALGDVVSGPLRFEAVTSLSPSQLQQVGLDDDRFRPKDKEFALCLYMDPMMDLVIEDA
jgi:hypothetical protein